MSFLRPLTASALASALLLASAIPALAEPVPADAVPADAPAIQLLGNAFTPGDAVVPVGTTVVFPNPDPEEHDVVPMDPNFSLDLSFFSPIIEPGTGWAFTFTVPGTYAYMCDLHANMTGTLTVA